MDGILEIGLVSQKCILLKTQYFYLNFDNFDQISWHPENKPLFKTPGLRLVLEGFTWFVHESWWRDRNLTAADRESPGESGSRAPSSCCPRSRFRLCFHDSWSSVRCLAKCSYHQGATSGGGLWSLVPEFKARMVAVVMAIRRLFWGCSVRWAWASCWSEILQTRYFLTSFNWQSFIMVPGAPRYDFFWKNSKPWGSGTIMAFGSWKKLKYNRACVTLGSPWCHCASLKMNIM